jgi:hypothetical protein
MVCQVFDALSDLRESAKKRDLYNEGYLGALREQERFGTGRAEEGEVVRCAEGFAGLLRSPSLEFLVKDATTYMMQSGWDCFCFEWS